MTAAGRGLLPLAVVIGAAVLSGCLSTSPSTPEAAPTSRSSTTASGTPSCTPSATTPSPDPRPSSSAARAGDTSRTALAALAQLPVKGRAPMTGYDRARFGQAWLDADRNGCDTRNDVLATRLRNADLKPGTRDCVVLSGELVDHYTGRTIHFVRGDGALVDIDHVVALANVWVTGGAGWDIRRRAAIANDPMNLEPVDASANRQKGAGDAATWLPPNRSYRCTYVARQVGVKRKYGLWVTPPEAAAMSRILAICPGEPVPQDSGAPTSVGQNLVDPYAAPTVAPSSQAAAPFANCDAARAAGAAPLDRGDPGYSPRLDREGDGTACE